MMRQSTPKPISSPGRADNFLPPLMRFLRSSVDNKSRERSRVSPLFLRRKKNSTTIEPHQEPSSPKVTCIGQVRVRRSNSERPNGSRKPDSSRNPSKVYSDKQVCCLFCFAGKLKPFYSLCYCPTTRLILRRPGCSCPGPSWRRWVSFFCCGSNWVGCGSSRDVSKRVGSGKVDVEEEDRAEEEAGSEEEAEEGRIGFGERGRAYRVSGSDPSTPPKNALLLTRCRSAPYRSTSLAVRFWGSPLMEEKEKEGEEKTAELENIESTEKAASEIEQARIDSAAESRIDREGGGNLGFREGEEREFKGSSKEEEERGEEGEEKREPATAAARIAEPVVEEGRGEEEEEKEIDVARPMVLTRCNSEPARSGFSERIDPETAIFPGGGGEREDLKFTETSSRRP